jgi:hypothetical protein
MSNSTLEKLGDTFGFLVFWRFDTKQKVFDATNQYDFKKFFTPCTGTYFDQTLKFSKIHCLKFTVHNNVVDY